MIDLQFLKPVLTTVKTGNNKDSNINLSFDSAAFELFFKQNFKSLCRYYQLRFGFDTDLCKEVVHTGFIKLWENRQSLSADFSVKTYLHKIINNACLDIIKHEKVRLKYQKHYLAVSDSELMQDHAHITDLRQIEAAIDQAVSDLPDQMQKIFKLSRYEGMKYREISAYLNISVKTVETQMGRALLRLKDKLAHYLSFYFLVLLLH